MGQNEFKRSEWLPILISGAALAVSIIALFLNVFFEVAKSKAQIEVWQRNTYFEGNNDNRTKITLLFRNLSHRPTAIVDIYVRDGEGILGGRGYENQVGLPIKIDPWGVSEVELRIGPNDEKKMKNILIRDIEDNEIIVNHGTGQIWTKAKINQQNDFYLLQYWFHHNDNCCSTLSGSLCATPHPI